MFTYSEIHDWQGEPAVKQILVFPSQLLKDEFDKEFALRVEKDGEKASDSNAGAIYKIRAVLNGKGLWDGVVRCGSSGGLLFEECDLGKNWKDAMTNVTMHFSGVLRDSCNHMFSSVLQKVTT